MFGSRVRLYNNSWVRDHYRFLFRSAWALTRSRSVAEEVVQDCFELAWRHMDQLKDKKLATPWLFQILRREALRNWVPATEAHDEERDQRTGADNVGVIEQRLAVLGALAGLLLTVGLSTAAFFQWMYPPELVREAMIHEHREATLRGDFQKNKLPMLMAMGLRDGGSLPGLLQMQRPCEIAEKTAYHLTTFIEKGGAIVPVPAFAEPMPAAPTGEGHWLGRHWRFAEGLPGKTVLLLADNAKVLSVTEDLLKKG